jgi:soluble lytic murein transglycosylase
MVKMRFRQWVPGLFLVGGMLILPYPVDSLDQPPVPCHHPEQCFDELLVELDRLDSGSTPSAKSEQLFQQLATVYGQTTWAHRAQLRYGRAIRNVSPIEAIPLLQRSLPLFPALDDYLKFWLLEAYVNAGLWQEAAKVVQEFSNGHQESRFRAAVLYEGGPVFTRMGDCHAARSVLSQALAMSPQHSKAAYALFQIGTCAGQLGQQEKMVEIFRELWWRFPLVPESRDAGKWLAQNKGSAFIPAVGELYQRGMSFYNRGALSKAVTELQKVIAVSKDTPQFFQSQFTLAKAWVRLKQYDQAEKALDVLTRSSSSRQDDAWVWLGRAYLRHGKGEALGNLVKTMPLDELTGDQQAQLYTFYGIWLTDHDQWLEAVQAHEKAGQVAQSFSRKVEALWRVGWIQYQREQFAEANTIFQQIIHQTNNSQSTSLRHAGSQALYWLARSQEHVGQVALATQHFEQLRQAYPLTYYGQLAQTRLGSKGEEPQAWEGLGSTEFQKKRIPAQLQQDIHFQKLQALQDVQLSNEAVNELEQVYALHGSDADLFPQLVSLAGAMGAYDIGIRLAIRHYGQTVRAGTLAPASLAWAGAFPMGYQQIIQSVVPQHVDPFLVSGLIREESLYSARVVSPAGAVGLMQLMPTTAKRVAQQLNLSGSGFAINRLFQPHYNIQLGTHYLGQLLNDFQGNIIYSVAAYNAGPPAVLRWRAKHGHRPSDEFVELIGYKETRGYVKRVVGSYRIYRTLFGKACPPISLDRFC